MRCKQTQIRVCLTASRTGAYIVIPYEFITAAKAVTQRGEQLEIHVTTVTAYFLKLPDGSTLAYEDATASRAFRSVTQIKDWCADHNLDPRLINALMKL